MRYHFFLHYGWFLQNFEKDFIPTLLHTTVYKWVLNFSYEVKSLSVGFFECGEFGLVDVRMNASDKDLPVLVFNIKLTGAYEQKILKF